ncbi:hypothetical protein J3F83DRAFT_766522 [Trichoderma novae-zelandiae]
MQPLWLPSQSRLTAANICAENMEPEDQGQDVSQRPHYTKIQVALRIPSPEPNATYPITDSEQQPRASTGPSNYNDAIARFLADPDQRRPTEFSTVQSAAEAKEAAQARIAAQLNALEQQFGGSNEPQAN